MRLSRSLALVLVLAIVGCERKQESAGKVMYYKGMPSRKLLVLFSRDTVEAEIVNNRIWRVSVVSPLFRTVDLLGVERRARACCN